MMAMAMSSFLCEHHLPYCAGLQVPSAVLSACPVPSVQCSVPLAQGRWAVSPWVLTGGSLEATGARPALQVWSSTSTSSYPWYGTVPPKARAEMTSPHRMQV